MMDITFDNPIYLWYLLSIPLLIYTHFYLLRHSRQKAMKFANFEALQRVTGERLITKNLTMLLLRIVLLCCIIFAVSGTTFWYQGKVSKNDFVFAIDTSASMAAEDVHPTRLDAAKTISADIVDNLKAKSDIGVISFSGTTFIETGMIDNRDTIKKTLDAITFAKAGGTDIAGAIITGTNMLMAGDKGRTMVLMTDGSNTVSSFMTDSILNGISYAKKNHVVIHTVGIGSETGPIGYLPEYYNVSAVYNENTLLQIANETRGMYFKAGNAEDLKSIKESIETASDKAQIPVHLDYGLMLIVLGILFLEWGLMSTKFRKIP